MPPKEWPTTTGRSIPSARAALARCAACACGEAPALPQMRTGRSGSDQPMPGRSNATTR